MKTAQLLLRKILENPSGLDWSIQGFGMLRLYLSKEIRLHLWNSQFSVPGVSLIHTHPWDFESEVIVGEIENTRYLRDLEGVSHGCAVIRCGSGGGILQTLPRVGLRAGPPEYYRAGTRYVQKAEEIHQSKPSDGTVTVVSRKFRPDADHALVFWESGDWVTAEPRQATRVEINTFVATSLALLSVEGEAG